MARDEGVKGSEIFAAVIENELQQERLLASSLEQRAIAVVTSSGILVSLVFGFGTLIKGQGAVPKIPTAARVLLALAVIAFVVAAVMTLLTNRPRKTRPLDVKADLSKMVTELWSISADDARHSIAEFRVTEVNRWRENNKLKSAYLSSAITIESCGIGLIAVSMALILA